MISDPRIAYFVTHPIQYQVPLIRRLLREGIDLKVAFATTCSAHAYYDHGFGCDISWDVPLLEGYPFSVLGDPDGPVPKWTGFRRYLSAIHRHLDSFLPDVVWVHGWGDAYSMAAIFAAWQRQIPVMIRGESHLRCIRGGRVRRFIHRQILRVLFRWISFFLTIGTANEEFYRAYGVPGHKMVRVPFSVDNDFFRSRHDACILGRERWRSALGVAPSTPLLLFVGKLITEKAPDTLMAALSLLHADAGLKVKPVLIMVGEGKMHDRLSNMAAMLPPGAVHFAGFRNQTELPAYYVGCDILVLPSVFEPWGVVVNEAMNSGLCIVASDHVGSAVDLVVPGSNGMVFPAGNAAQLAAALKQVLLRPEMIEAAGQKSQEIVSRWGLTEDIEGIKRVLTLLGEKQNLRS